MNKFNVAALSLSVESISVEQFKNKLEIFIDKAKKSNVSLILLPEYSFAPIISAVGDNIFNASELTEAFLIYLSNKYDIAICGCGIYQEFEFIYNQAYFIKNDKIIYQQKINLIESEKSAGLSYGSVIKIIETPFAKLAILICYDIEFPELTRKLAKSGVNLILVPSYTVDNFGASRVEFCSRARAIENHIYVLKSCLIGNKGHQLESPSGKGFSALYSPCDRHFHENGIVASASSDFDDGLCIGEIDYFQLNQMKQSAATNPFADYLNLCNRNISLSYTNILESKSW